MSDGETARRRFLGGAAQGVAAAACGGFVWNAMLAKETHAAPYALRPPGARAEPELNATCAKCGLCVAACPYGTLKLASAGTPVPLGTPYFTPREVPCRMCPDIPCAKACPTGALDRTLDDIARARMGLAVVDAEHCLSWQGLRCEVCYRVCPVRGAAITIDPHPRQLSKHAVFVPVVHADACTGCGLCEQACPTEVAAVRIVQPALVQGRIGAHYRLGWKEEVAPGDAPTPRAPAPAAVPPPSVPGLDYLNSGDRP